MKNKLNNSNNNNNNNSQNNNQKKKVMIKLKDQEKNKNLKKQVTTAKIIMKRNQIKFNKFKNITLINSSNKRKNSKIKFKDRMNFIRSN